MSSENKKMSEWVSKVAHRLLTENIYAASKDKLWVSLYTQLTRQYKALIKTILLQYTQTKCPVILRVAVHRKYRRPRSRPHLIDNIFGALFFLKLLLILIFLFYLSISSRANIYK